MFYNKSYTLIQRSGYSFNTKTDRILLHCLIRFSPVRTSYLSLSGGGGGGEDLEMMIQNRKL